MVHFGSCQDTDSFTPCSLPPLIKMTAQWKKSSNVTAMKRALTLGTVRMHSIFWVSFHVAYQIALWLISKMHKTSSKNIAWEIQLPPRNQWLPGGKMSCFLLWRNVLAFYKQVITLMCAFLFVLLSEIYTDIYAKKGYYHTINFYLYLTYF